PPRNFPAPSSPRACSRCGLAAAASALPSAQETLRPIALSRGGPCPATSQTTLSGGTFARGPGSLTHLDVQATAQGNGRSTVLPVEDDDDAREAVEQILTQEGFHVVAAPDGGVALEVLARGEHRFCTIILDVLMPGVDGAEFLARAREQL